ncbi:MAG: hypothetical protein WA547_05565 [Thermoplasmata archaeon]
MSRTAGSQGSGEGHLRPAGAGAVDGAGGPSASDHRYPLMEGPEVARRMGSASGALFVARGLSSMDVTKSSIAEFGTQGFGVRSLLEPRHPREYVGVDVARGAGADVVTDVARGERFGANRFDVVVSSEQPTSVRGEFRGNRSRRTPNCA